MARAAASGPPVEPLTKRAKRPSRTSRAPRQLQDRLHDGRQRAQRLGGRAEPAQVDVDVAQRRMDARQREVLGGRRADGARLLAAGELERAPVAAGALVHEAPAVPGEAGGEHHAGGARARPAAHRRGARARVEVADLHARGVRAGVAQRERAGEVAGHPVVAEGRQQPAAGGLRARAEALEHGADEAPLARRVQVVRAGGDRGLHGRLAPALERADGRDEHVAALHERAHGVGPGDVGDRPLQAAELLGQGADAPLVPGGQHGPRSTIDEGPGGEIARVAGGAEDDDAFCHSVSDP